MPNYRQRKAIIITKDEDFSARLYLIPSELCIVWVRFGNCPNRILLERMQTLLPDIIQRLTQNERIIEIV